jgi:hypothetical protein
MADDKDLRNALDAVNAGRKWTLLGMGALFFAITITLGFVFGMLVPALQPPGPPQEVTIETPAGPPSIAINRLMPLKVLWVSTAFQLFFVACGTIAIMLHVSRMTRAVLRAIEATRK